jgi:hypothetical protein
VLDGREWYRQSRDPTHLPYRIGSTPQISRLCWYGWSLRIDLGRVRLLTRSGAVHRLHTVHVPYARSDLCIGASGVGADGVLGIYRQCVFALGSASCVGMAMGVYVTVEVGSGSGVAARHSVLFVAWKSHSTGNRDIARIHYTEICCGLSAICLCADHRNVGGQARDT